jgi:sugar lactone lactonase YvrE
MTRLALLDRTRSRLWLDHLEARDCPSGFTVITTGLDNPRGMTFGPDGQMYVAQGGPPSNTLSTANDPTVQQVPPPIGPYTGGFNSSIVRVDRGTGSVAPVVTGLPSSQTSDKSGDLVSGVADVAFLGGVMYGIEAGAGPSHGIGADPVPAPVLTGTANTVFRVNPDGSTTVVADLSAFQHANPVVNPEPDDFEPDGTWYSMVAIRGALYAVEPNHGELDRITPDGQITRVADISATQGHVVPTAVAYQGNFYVGNLGTFGLPHHPESIYKITPSGQIRVVATGLSEVLGVDFDSQGRMYVLESSTGGVAPIPGTGDVLRFNDDGTRTVLADGLTFPTAMQFGPDGDLYVSNIGFGIPGAGQIVRIDVAPSMHVMATVSKSAGGLLSAEGLPTGTASPRASAKPAHHAYTQPPVGNRARHRIAPLITSIARSDVSFGFVPGDSVAGAADEGGALGLDD